VPTRPEEIAASEILSAIFRAPLDHRDKPGAPPGTYDFAVLRPEGPTAAVEVTTLTVQSDVQLSAEMRKRGALLESTGLRSVWWVEVRPGNEQQTYKRVRERLPMHLSRLELLGIERFHEDFDTPAAVRELLDDLPVHTGSVTPSSYKERIYLVETPRATFVSGANVNNAIEDALRAGRFDGELDKLARSRAEERHLFVWVDWRLYPAFEGLCSDDPPDSAPALPLELTDLWAAARCMHDYATWQATAADTWELHRLSRLLDE